MYICYLDESGTVEPGANSDHFVLLGLAIPAETWKEKDQQVLEIKRRYGLEDFEIHTAWMARDYPEQARVPDFDRLEWSTRRQAVLGVRAMNLGRARRQAQLASITKNYRKSDAYIHLNRTERLACLRDLSTLIGSWRDSRAFAEARAKSHVPAANAFDQSFEQVVTRFNTFLTVVNGPNGLLVQDNNQTMALRLTTAMRRYHEAGTLWSTIDRIVETPLFVDSQLTSMIQMADLCAYATRRFFERNERDLFRRVFPRFDRHRRTLVGLRHYTGGFRCQCHVCKAHGRYA